MDQSSFAVWLSTALGEQEIDVPTLAKRTGISASIIYRWLKGYKPNIENCRLTGHALDKPVLEVLVAAGVLTADEANATVTATPTIAELPTSDLTRELHRRAENHEQNASPERVQQLAVEHLAMLLQGVQQGDPHQEPPDVRVATDSDGNRYAMQPLGDKSP